MLEDSSFFGMHDVESVYTYGGTWMRKQIDEWPWACLGNMLSYSHFSTDAGAEVLTL